VSSGTGGPAGPFGREAAVGGKGAVSKWKKAQDHGQEGGGPKDHSVVHGKKNCHFGRGC